MPRPPLYRGFLDGGQYSRSGIALYQAAYGDGFVSPGGADMAAELLAQLQLKPGQQLLDVGCGIGGMCCC
jgi:2-polyprenyl-3-methyl-5-hydroxy-6-metoxy-1,4-benzoquinol methylase